ncbi:MAG: hypothetical protein C4348_01850, partial [Patescibacteria group bacterium]
MRKKFNLFSVLIIVTLIGIPLSGLTQNQERRGEDLFIGGSPTALDLAFAILTTNTAPFLVSAEKTGRDIQFEVYSISLQGFPTDGSSWALISTGKASDIAGEATTFYSYNTGGPTSPPYSHRGNPSYDIATLSLTLFIPPGATTLSFDWRFATEENPTYIGQFVDWARAIVTTPDGQSVNILLLPNGKPVDVDNALPFSNPVGCSSYFPCPPFPEPNDTVYNAITGNREVYGIYKASFDVRPYAGQTIRIDFQIADENDPILDSALFIDNLNLEIEESLIVPTEFWVEIKKDGECIYQDENLTTKLKCFPQGWVLKIPNPEKKTWEKIPTITKIEDVTDGVSGWTRKEFLNYNPNKQEEWKRKTEKLDPSKNPREGGTIPIILEAVNRYYSNIDVTNSLYGTGGGRDGNNDFQKFIKGSLFPKELILAIAAQESGPEFNNEICSFAKDGGIGIMQITSLSYKGLGSGLDNYSKKNDCNAKTGWIGEFSKYYSNSMQGIYANIKDGFRVLQEKYRQKCPKESIVFNGLEFTCQDIEKILIVWGYNGFAKDKITGEYKGTYLKDVANKLARLGEYFPGIIYDNKDKLIEKLELANKNKKTIKLYSPAQLQIID